MTWVRIWLPDYTIANIDDQRAANTALINANVLGGELMARLRDTVHVLATVADAEVDSPNIQ